MRYLGIDSVEPGQLLGKSIFAGNGTVLLSEGVQLTVYMINTLRRIGVDMLYIQDANFQDIQIHDVISDETKRKMISNMSEMIKAIRSGREFDPRKVSVSVDRLLEDVMRNRDLLIHLTDIRTKDNGAYVHAMNVCMMSTIIGINMQYDPNQLKELAIGALLHDIGKFVKQDPQHPQSHHAWIGFEFLKKKRDYSLMSAHVAFQHHECPDGSGEPRGLTDEQIHPYAKIVALVNLYDNLLFEQSTRRKMQPFEAFEQLLALSGTKVDRAVLLEFINIISIYPTGISVRLSTKETGVVVGQHRGLPSRPIVRVIKGDDTHGDLEVKEIDLVKNRTVFIEEVLT